MKTSQDQLTSFIATF